MTINQQHEQQKVEQEWVLSSDQMIFMLQYHNAVETAYADDDMEFLRQLAESDDYQTVFGAMSWDEAYDRYETMIENANP
jgi:hypothetical protein